MAITVTGMGSRLDLPRAQNAVNADSEVILRGTFFFGTSGVKVTKPVTISGEGATIMAGKIPFDVNAPGAVTIKGLRFVNPQQFAIQVLAVKDLEVSNCNIEKVTLIPVNNIPIGGGILVAGAQTTGNLTIVNNSIDVGGGPSDRSFGMMFNAVGNNQGGEVTILITNNSVMNVTAHGIDLRNIVGQATIERNPITTGLIGGQQVSLPDKFVDGIRCLGLGTYIVRGNLINCGYENAAGIRLQGSTLSMPITVAAVEANEITMSAETHAPPTGNESAGIEIRRNCTDSVVLKNTILGQARAALSLIAEPAMVGQQILPPSKNNLIENDHKSFTSGQSDIFVGAGVSDTHIEGGTGGTIVASGSIGTTINPPNNYK